MKQVVILNEAGCHPERSEGSSSKFHDADKLE
jgi:hypothetical protein